MKTEIKNKLAFGSIILILLAAFALSDARANESEPKELDGQWIWVNGNSMLPTLHNGEWVYVNTHFNYSELKEGMIVLKYGDMDNPGIRIVHRLAHHKTWLVKGWETKGDNNHRFDKGLMTKSNFIGVVDMEVSKKMQMAGK